MRDDGSTRCEVGKGILEAFGTRFHGAFSVAFRRGTGTVVTPLPKRLSRGSRIGCR